MVFLNRGTEIQAKSSFIVNAAFVFSATIAPDGEMAGSCVFLFIGCPKCFFLLMPIGLAINQGKSLSFF